MIRRQLTELPTAYCLLHTATTVKDLLRAFLAYLRLNRNASVHTVRAYESDLDQFTTYLAADLKRPRPELQPADITRPMIRGFLADLFRRGESRADFRRAPRPQMELGRRQAACSAAIPSRQGDP